ncbi:Arc family DNA-binding protein [Pseudomonas linyingensis]|nr:Arc family DNA-binding protein [Pseudomonas linyingensis]
MSKIDLQVNFRMPADLKARLEAVAKENHRSLTAEIVARLEESLIPRTMDAIEAARPAELERELTDLSVQSYHLTYELSIIQKQIVQAETDEERFRLIRQADELSARIAEVEVLRMKKMQQVAMLKRNAAQP